MSKQHIAAPNVVAAPPVVTAAELQSEIEKLKSQIDGLKKRKKFGLVWEDKPEAVAEQSKNQLPVLTEVGERALLAAPNESDQPTHLIIEGDNYHALQILNYTHQARVDVIYIDPPYNTGARDWKYNNDYVDANDAYRHSKWLSMMAKRLRLAKNLLSESGILICTIDHYELYTLGSLLDDIFGEENHEGVITVVHKAEGRQFAKRLNATAEFYLIYSKDKEQSKINNIPLDDEDLTSFNLEDENGRYRLEDYIRRGGGNANLRQNKPSAWYPVYVSDDLSIISLNESVGLTAVYPVTESGQERTWNTSKETFTENLQNGVISAKNEDGRIVIYRKYREQRTVKTHWIKPAYNATRYGTQLLTQIIGENDFSFPKSLYAVIDALKITVPRVVKQDESCVILDFFAGSGTTGHAVLELNKQDGGRRQFILCTNNENDIAEKVCYPRVAKVITGYGEGDHAVAGIPANLRYFRTAFVPTAGLSALTDDDRLALAYQAGGLIALKENTFTETERADAYQIFTDGGRRTVIYFAEDKNDLPALAEKLEAEKIPTALYVFSWGKDEYRAEYETKTVRVEDIPEPILAVYREINQ